MNKTELIKSVSQRAEMPATEIKDILNHTLDTITETLQKKEIICITGFGKFYTKDYKGRERRLPTGEIIQTEDVTTPHFKAGSTLKDIVSGRNERAEA